MSPGSLPTRGVLAAPVRPRRPTLLPHVAPTPPSTESVPVTPMLEPGTTIPFQLEASQGAALVTRYHIFRQDAVGNFDKYVKKHYASWVTFAQEHGHGDVKPVLVTGVDRTKDFAMLSYSRASSDNDELRAEFTIPVPEVASTFVWGTWHTTGFIHKTCGPQLSGGNRAEPGSDWYDQCVFVRYSTIRKRMGIPKVIKAGAGPHNLGPGSREGREPPKVEVRSPSDSGSDPAPSLYDDEEVGDRSSATSTESESDTIIHNTAPVCSYLCLPARFCPT